MVTKQGREKADAGTTLDHTTEKTDAKTQLSLNVVNPINAKGSAFKNKRILIF